MTAAFTVRTACTADAAEIKDLFRNTILAVNRRDYSPAEVEDWASCGNDLSRFEAMIGAQYFIVSVSPQGLIAGYASMTPQGYLDHLFVHKDFQRQGVATLLLVAIEKYAAAQGIKRITSEVSLTARPFFERRGFVVEAAQERKANNLFLKNFRMAKG